MAVKYPRVVFAGQGFVDEGFQSLARRGWGFVGSL
jgi:hypothetical protein